LVRAAKAVAARRGITLTALVLESLARAVEDDRTPGSDAASEPDLHADQAWLEEHRGELEREHPGEYVTIVDGAVVDHDPQFAPLARRMLERFGRRPVLMPRLTPGGRVVDLPSPRVERS
jgi:hypothetical protein